MSSAFLDPAYFESLSAKALAGRKPGEHFYLNLGAESSQFIRLNGPKVRQIGAVEDADVSITLILEQGSGPNDGQNKPLKTATASTTLCGLSYEDHERIGQLIEGLRREVPELPADPYAILPKDHGSSKASQTGTLLPFEEATDAILKPLAGTDVAGIFASGSIARAMANSAGQLHWFLTHNFSLDYSLYTPSQRALKGTFAGNRWDAQAYAREIEDSRKKLELLERPARRLERGAYRTYLEPAAYADLVRMLNWHGISESAIRQGDSPLRLMRPTAGAPARHFSPLFDLSEDFSSGMVPRFNGDGELAPEKLTLIEKGQLVQSLVSSRTALEYSVPSNGAEDYEAMRAPSLKPGTLDRRDALKKLGTGLSLSNLHYLNWSDGPGGRVTGMTRYACFWVENGEIIAPIENMRFDVSLFSVLGDALEALTTDAPFIPQVESYGGRDIGGIFCPGALLGAMEFTL